MFRARRKKVKKKFFFKQNFKGYFDKSYREHCKSCSHSVTLDQLIGAETEIRPGVSLVPGTLLEERTKINPCSFSAGGLTCVRNTSIAHQWCRMSLPGILPFKIPILHCFVFSVQSILTHSMSELKALSFGWHLSLWGFPHSPPCSWMSCLLYTPYFKSEKSQTYSKVERYLFSYFLTI